MRPNEVSLSAGVSRHRCAIGHRRAIMALSCFAGVLLALPFWASPSYWASEPTRH